MQEEVRRIIAVTKAALEKEMSAVFLDVEEIAALTGRKIKSKQIEMLRKMGLPFFVNACGKPVVTRSVIEGKKETPQTNVWEMPRRGTKAK